MTLKIMLELDADQENFVVLALMDAATQAWNTAIDGDLEDGHSDECKEFWRKQLAIAESVLGQFSAQVMDSWRHMLSHPYDADDEPAHE
jgi:hypothetical protein